VQSGDAAEPDPPTAQSHFVFKVVALSYHTCGSVALSLQK
jgi:hypothetical protein